MGTFISLDGVDGAGKSTQCRLLADWLRFQGHRVTTCRDPGGTLTGDRIREILLDKSRPMGPPTEAFLYMASRSLLVDEIIRPALSKGDIVLTDRFLLSNVVYQGHAGTVSVEALWQMGHLATGGLLPTLTFVLDIPVPVALARKTGEFDRVESKGLDYLEKVREGFLVEARRHPDRIRVMSAARPIDDLQADLRLEVSRVLEGASRP